MAHMYGTGGMQRLYLRGRANIRKRLLVHACGFNLGVLMRAVTGIGTPRTCRDRGGSWRATVHSSFICPSGPPMAAFWARLGACWG